MADTSPKGAIQKALDVGFKPMVLVPIAPITAPANIGSPGKSPAWFGPYGWQRVGNWQNGVQPKVLAEADIKGANAGLLLGNPAGGRIFWAFDIDTDGDDDPSSSASRLAKAIQVVTMRALREILGESFWVRGTRPYRALVLLSALQDEAPGGKLKIDMFKNGNPCGKLELLAKGQQCVIAGTHPWNGGTPIRWARRGVQKLHDVPKLDAGLPILDSRAQADRVVDYVLKALRTSLNIDVQKQKSSVHTSGPMPLDEQLPWSSDDFIRLFKAMPHDHRVTRESYVTTMLAAWAGVNATALLRKPPTAELDAMRDAAVDWAARWQDPLGEGTSFVQEMDAWTEDFSSRRVEHVGWQYLVQRAITLGDTDLSLTSATYDFEFDEASEGLPILIKSAPPMNLGSDVPNPTLPPTLVFPSAHEQGLPMTRQGRAIRFDIKSSEIQIADALQETLAPICAWMLDQKRWIAWGGHGVGWSTPYAEKSVRVWLENLLVDYVAKYDESLGDNIALKASIASERRISSLEKLLRMRMGMTCQDIDKGHDVLQTPAGMYDLATGLTVDWRPQRAMRETRLTAYSPVEGPTPLWDDLLMHLACQDRPTADWLAAYLGYALVGRPLAHVMLTIVGPGGNGKDKLLNIARRILGDYAASIDRSVIVNSGKREHLTALAETAGKRLWCVSEIDEDEKWNEARLKGLSGGVPIKARHMNQDMQTYENQGSMLIATNFVPPFHRIDASVVRRFRLIHARVRVSAEKMNLNFEEDVLDSEGPAILFKLMQSAKEIIANRMQLPEPSPLMTQEAKRWMLSQDTFQIWFGNECVACPVHNHNPIPIQDLEKRYRAFVDRMDGQDDEATLPGETNSMTTSAFINALRRAGVICEDGSGRAIKDATGLRVAHGVQFKVRMAA